MPNPLKFLYIKVWMPIFGRLLAVFIPVIEGSKPIRKPKYKFNDKTS